MAHALLSPSGASRWLECTPSARLEAERPDKAGEAADEGTLAHKLSELMLKFELGFIKQADYKKSLAAIEKNKHYSDAMWEYCDNFKTFVLERLAEAQLVDTMATIFLERQLDMTDYVPEGFGTGDVLIVANGTLYIIDLKYGKGVLVEATDNKQLMLYALGALKEMSMLFEITDVSMIIYQPRIDNFSQWNVPTSYLEDWAENELKPKAQLAWAGKGDLKPGKHCQFCKVRAMCIANAEYHMSLAELDFEEPKLLTDDQLVEILGKVESLVKWANTVKAHVYNEALQGKKWPGYKLIVGKSPGRKIVDVDKAIKIFKENGYSIDKYLTKPTLFGITALDKNIGKEAVAGLLDGLIITPKGKPALVPENRKGIEWHSTEDAVSEFAEFDDDTAE